MCILNGRVTPDKNDLTFVSKRGSSVVDYIITPHESGFTTVPEMPAARPDEF